jgi:HK97 family phage major capsid protein
MKTITQMREEIASLMKELGKMKAQVVAENRDPSQLERSKASDILDRVDELEKNIAMEERIQETSERLAKPKEEPTKPETTTTSLSDKEQKKKDRFLTFGEQLQAVANAGSDRRIIDPRLKTRAISGMGETVSSDGGFLVQQDFATEIIKQVFETGKLASRIQQINLGDDKNGLKINGIDESTRATGSRWGGIRMYWLEEAGTKTKSKPKFRQIELSLKKLIGLCYATDELLADAAALESVVRQAFENELGFMMDDAIINGTGAGQPLGVMNAACMVQQNKETGQAATTIVHENIVKMWSRLIADSRPNAVWLINQDCEPQLHTMGLAVGTGGVPSYLPPGGLTASPYASLMGRPVIPMEQCQTLGTNGDIILGDFSKYLGITKGGVKTDVSIHVRFVNDESVFRWVFRFDGQPVLHKAITPYKGNNTLSHFVKLQTRS